MLVFLLCRAAGFICNSLSEVLIHSFQRPGGILPQPGEILIEGRVGDVYAVAAKNLCVAVGVKSGDGKAHGDAVVEVAVAGSAVKWLAAMDDNASIGSANICAHSGKVLHHNIDPV